MKITLKKTSERTQRKFGTKGKIGVTPASYDIYCDGEKIGTIMGGCHSTLSCKSGYQKGEVCGKKLKTVGVKGKDRKEMEEEIKEIIKNNV